MNDISVKEVLGDIAMATVDIYAFDYLMRSMIRFVIEVVIRALG